MNTAERFKRMRQVERQLEKLVRRGWSVKQVVYDDEEGCDFQTRIILATDGKDEKDGVF